MPSRPFFWSFASNALDSNSLLHWIWRHDLKYMIMSSSRPPQHEATSAFDNWQPLKVPVTELRLYHTRRESVRQFGLFLVTRTIFVEKTCWAGGAGWNKEQHTTKYKKVGNANLTWPRKSFHHKLFQQIQTFEKKCINFRKIIRNANS